jgi:hypothetical protein
MFAKTIRPTNVVPVVGSRASTAFGNATVTLATALAVDVDFGVGDPDEHAPNTSARAATAADASSFPVLIFRQTRTAGADIPASFYLRR